MVQAFTHGSGSAQRGEKVTQVMSDEHRVIERVLTAVDQLTKRPAKESLELWKKALDFIRGFADGCHHYKEEQVLFPALEEHGIPRDGGPVGMMLIEHEEGRSYVRAMAEAVGQIEAGKQGKEEALFENARSYLRLLHEHIQKEDDVLFVMANDVIPTDKQPELLNRFENYEAEEMGKGTHEKYLKIAEELAAATG